MGALVERVWCCQPRWGQKGCTKIWRATGSHASSQPHLYLASSLRYWPSSLMALGCFPPRESRVKICVLERQGVNSRTNLLQREQHIGGTDLPLSMWQLMYPKQKVLKFAWCWEGYVEGDRWSPDTNETYVALGKYCKTLKKTNTSD